MTHHLVRPCAECQRPTRPPHLKLSECPETMVRRGPLCHSCRMYAQPAMSPAQERAHAYHLAGLNSFLHRRHARELSHARADHLHAFLERVNA